MSGIDNDGADNPSELIQEHKDLVEELADSDFPIAKDAQRALEIVNKQRGENK